MRDYSRILIVVITIVFLGMLYLSGSQGWWVSSFRNDRVIREYQKERRAYGVGYYGNGSSRSGRLRNRSSRSFRGGSRRGGK